MLRPLRVALQFLTRIPLPGLERIADRDPGDSLLWYPAVGLLLGLVLVMVAWLLAPVSNLLVAALLLLFWVILTGALHLDGLADSADAWMGGLGSRERSLAILQDPYCGVGAVVAVVLVLLVKFAAIESMLETDDWGRMWLAPVLGRSAVALLFLTTPYVRPGGLGEQMAQHLPRTALWVVLVSTALAIFLISGGVGILVLLGAGIMFMVLRALMLGRLQGMTGDTAGALLELTEAAVLVTAAIA